MQIFYLLLLFLLIGKIQIFKMMKINAQHGTNKTQKKNWRSSILEIPKLWSYWAIVLFFFSSGSEKIRIIVPDRSKCQVSMKIIFVFFGENNFLCLFCFLFSVFFYTSENWCWTCFGWKNLILCFLYMGCTAMIKKEESFFNFLKKLWAEKSDRDKPKYMVLVWRFLAKILVFKLLLCVFVCVVS